MATYGLRRFISLGSLGLFVWGSPPAAAAEISQQTPCVTEVQEGRLAGLSAGGVCSFRAVPYAAPPVNDRRFRAPALPLPWAGVRDASTPINVVCPRVAANVAESYVGPAPDPLNEDCLKLNVWTPAVTGSRPIIVFFHGGAFRSGSGSQADLDGARMAAAGNAVVITVNSRLGMLGYLELGEIEPSLKGSGNNGLRDQIAALEWIRRNAGAFGGDPANITAAGQSAGAISIAALLAGHPRRLFRRAILESGSGYLMQSQERSLATARTLIGNRSAYELQHLPVADLMVIQKRYLAARPVSGSFAFGPSIDHDLVPGIPEQRIAAGSARGVDLLVGTNESEATFFTLAAPPLSLLPAWANPFFPSEAKQQLGTVASAYPAIPRDRGLLAPARASVMLRMLTDQLFRVPATRLAETQANQGARVHMYRFDWRAPDSWDPTKSVGALHCAELPFVFGSLRTGWIPGATTTSDAELAARRRLSDQMIAAWTSFARTGNPNAPGGSLPAWPQYSPDSRETMLLDRTSTVEDAPRDHERAAWSSIPLTELRYNLSLG